jgi:hypothetical protein
VSAAREEVSAVARVLLFIVLLGGVIYLAIRLIQRPGGGGGGVRFGRRPDAPDDDPKFLRDLDTQLWEQQRRNGERGQSDDPQS